MVAEMRRSHLDCRRDRSGMADTVVGSLWLLDPQWGMLICERPLRRDASRRSSLRCDRGRSGDRCGGIAEERPGGGGRRRRRFRAQSPGCDRQRRSGLQRPGGLAKAASRCRRGSPLGARDLNWRSAPGPTPPGQLNGPVPTANINGMACAGRRVSTALARRAGRGELCPAGIGGW